MASVEKIQVKVFYSYLLRYLSFVTFYPLFLIEMVELGNVSYGAFALVALRSDSSLAVAYLTMSILFQNLDSSYENRIGHFQYIIFRRVQSQNGIAEIGYSLKVDVA